MHLPTLNLYFSINVTTSTVLVWIFTLVCCDYCIFIFPTFFTYSSTPWKCLGSPYTSIHFIIPFFMPMLSKYYACTQASSNNMGLNNITYFRRWQCRSPRYLRSTYRFFRDIPNIVAIFLNFLLYTYTFPLLLLELVLPKSLLLYIPNRFK